jgi:hypothetical protein
MTVKLKRYKKDIVPEDLEYTISGRFKQIKNDILIELKFPREQIIDGVIVPDDKIGEFVNHLILKSFEGIETKNKRK